MSTGFRCSACDCGRWWAMWRHREWTIRRCRVAEILTLADPPPGPVLDFGAGDGSLVAAMRAQGIEAAGVDPSATARRLAERRHGLALLEAPPAQSGSRFAAITMLHALEHVPGVAPP